MTTTLRQHCLEEVREDCKLILYNACHTFIRTHGKRFGTFDELLSFAEVSFINAYDKWDERRGGFHGWVKWCLHNDLRTLLMRGMRDYKRHGGTVDEWFPDTHRSWDLGRWADDLSNDARTAALLVADTPPDLELIIQRDGGRPGTRRRCVREYLLGLGWDKARIKAAFDEVRESL